MLTVHVGNFYFNPIGLVFPFALGALVGLLGGWWTTVIVGRPITRRAIVIDMILGGMWWATSAVFPQRGFPVVFIRSLGGAVLIPVPYQLFECWLRPSR